MFVDPIKVQAEVEEVLEQHTIRTIQNGRRTVAQLASILTQNKTVIQHDVVRTLSKQHHGDLNVDETDELMVLFHATTDVGVALLTFSSLEDSTASGQALCEVAQLVEFRIDDADCSQRVRTASSLWRSTLTNTLATSSTLEHVFAAMEKLVSKGSEGATTGHEAVCCLRILCMLVREFEETTNTFQRSFGDKLWSSDHVVLSTMLADAVDVCLEEVCTIACGICSGRVCTRMQNEVSRSYTMELTAKGILSKVLETTTHGLPWGVRLLEGMVTRVHKDDRWFAMAFLNSGWLSHCVEILRGATTNTKPGETRYVVAILAITSLKAIISKEVAQEAIAEKLDIVLMRFALAHDKGWELLLSLSEASPELWQPRFCCIPMRRPHSTQTTKPSKERDILMKDLCDNARDMLLERIANLQTSKCIICDNELVLQMSELWDFQRRREWLLTAYLCDDKPSNSDVDTSLLQKAFQAADRRRACLQRTRNVARLTGDLPEDLLCPITHEVFTDPVVASDGNTYERAAIERVVGGSKKARHSPITREPLTNTVVRNMHVYSRVERLLEQQGLCTPARSSAAVFGEWWAKSGLD